MIELVPHFVVAASILFIEPHNVNHGLGVFFLFLLRDTVFLQETLPFLGKAGELAGLVIIAHMSDMYWVLWGRNLDASRGA